MKYMGKMRKQRKVLGKTKNKIKEMKCLLYMQKSNMGIKNAFLLFAASVTSFFLISRVFDLILSNIIKGMTRYAIAYFISFCIIPLFIINYEYGNTLIKEHLRNEMRNILYSLYSGFAIGVVLFILVFTIGFIFKYRMAVSSLTNKVSLVSINYLYLILFTIKYGIMMILSSLGEEYTNRFIIYSGLRKHFNSFLATILCSLFFLALHFEAFHIITNILGIFIGSVIICYVYEKKGLVWQITTAHVVYNTLIYIAQIILRKPI